MNGSDGVLFKQFSENGAKALDIIRETAYSPDSSKTLRRWGILEASTMVGRSAQHIRTQEKEDKLPKPQYIDENNRKFYSLDEINAIRHHFGTKPHKPEQSDPAIIAFANFKGGAAKTTSAVHSAQFFAKKGYRVLLIDCDSQASATQIFGYIPDEQIKEDETLLPCFKHEIDNIATIIKKTHWAGLDLIPANLSLYNAEFILPRTVSEMSKEGKKYEFYGILKNHIDQIKHNYDIIIMDCPPSMGMISINAIYAANSIIIPTPSAMLDFTSAIQFFKMMHEVSERLPPKKFNFVRILITKHESRTSSDGIVQILRQLYGKYVMLNVMQSTEVIKKASADMCTIYEIEKYSGSKKTLDRAQQAVDNVNDEIEALIKDSWKSTTKDKSASALNNEEVYAP